MPAALRIFLSYSYADLGVAEGLYKQLQATFAGQALEVCDRTSLYPGADSLQGGEAWLRWADLCIVVFSADYLGQETSQEFENAKRLERERRPALQILIAYARNADLPLDFQAFPLAPHPGEPIMQHGFDRDRQLQRVAQAARRLLELPPTNTVPDAQDDFEISMASARQRLLEKSERLNLLPAFALLRRIAADARLKKSAYELEDNFGEILRQGRSAKLALHEFLEKATVLRSDLQYLIQKIHSPELIPDWQAAFQKATHSVPGNLALFSPKEEIAIPNTLNLPPAPGEEKRPVGSLTSQQQADFRRQLLLAQDAMEVENFGRAYQHSDHVRSHIDPQSAQLYEYLLLTYLQKETSDRIALDAVDDDKRHLLNHIILYASRLREYQATNQCPTPTGEYNLRAAAEELGESLSRWYDALPNDHLLDTGKRGEEAPDNRAMIGRAREMGELIFRSVHPYSGFLEVLINELCGGGKFDWIQQVAVAKDEFVFLSREKFELETSINELLNLLVAGGQPYEQLHRRLREHLFLSLQAKSRRLHRYVAEERRRFRQFTDPRASVIRFVQACLLGYNVFGDETAPEDQSLLRLVMEYLLPNFLLEPTADAAISLHWFDLDEVGEVRTHPDCTGYSFDAQAIVEKIVRDHAGQAGWMQVAPNMKESVWLQYAAEIERDYEQVRRDRNYTDFRRPHELDSRRIVISCLRRWVIAFRAFPERGQDFLDRCIREIIGDGILLWLHHDPDELVTTGDSQMLGYDAREELKNSLALSTRYTEPEVRQMLAENLFQKRILPLWETLHPGREGQFPLAIRLLRETLSGYQLHPDV
ncbi:MAG: TIR domain-containing protein, partial [Saprospiraceae bacterium]